MRKLSIAFGAAALSLTALAGGIAYAQSHDHDGPASAPAPSPVKRADVEAMAGQMFDRMDVNKDGKVDAADRAAKMAQRFAEIDTNKDGSISRDEFMAAHQGGRDMAMGCGKGPGAMGGGPRGERMAAMMDANGDKAVTRQEMVAGALRQFDAADANKDGILSPDERRAAMKARQMDRRGAPPPPPGDMDD